MILYFIHATLFILNLITSRDILICIFYYYSIYVFTYSIIYVLEYTNQEVFGYN